MKMIRRILLLVLALLLLVVAGGAAAIWNITRSPLPAHSGEVTLSGLRGRVEVIRDGLGIPHIYASSLHDLFFAQGYVQAQDRWWQMEFSRHIGGGRIQELTGRSSSLIGTDIFIRQVGWRRAAERELETYDEATLSHLQAFADGVNAYILNRAPGQLALEYSILGLTGVTIPIEPWAITDTLMWAKIMQWDLGGNYDHEEFQERLVAVLGAELFAQWYPSFPYEQFPTIVREEDIAALPEGGSATSVPAAVEPRTRIIAAGNLPLDTGFIFGAGAGIGSNNWVVSGSRTQSGAPLLANDPHLGIGMPSIWYEVGLHCQPVSEMCPIDAVGFAFPSSPAVIIGHNGRIAWGVTNVGPDTQDLYRIEVNPDNELQYRWNGEWRDFVVYEETVRFGDGAEPITTRVRETHLGPVINDNRIDQETGLVLGFNNDDPLALRWTAFEPGTLWRAVLGINAAHDWESFREALRDWDSPSQNFVYADVDGNIGYQTPGLMPIRAVGEDGMTPSRCAEDACLWQGYIPYDLLPSVYNPERSFIVTANQALVPPGYYVQLAEILGGEPEQYVISQNWDLGFRGARINELVEASTAHTRASMAAIQADNKLLVAEALAPALRDLSLSDGALTGIRDWMLEWDYQLDRSSARGAFWMLFLERLSKAVFNDQLVQADEETQGSSAEMLALMMLVEQPDSAWWDDITTTDVAETPEMLMARAVAEALADAEARLGTDREAWRWGALHTTTFESNPLGLSGIDPIEQIVNRGPFETSGGRIAVNATSWAFGARGFTVSSAPSMRMIVDLSDFDNSLASNTTGQSGHPFSPQYDNLIQDWLSIQHHPMLWTRDAVNAAAAETLVLLPGGG